VDTTAVVAIITLAGSLLISAFTQRSAKTDKVVPEYQLLTSDLRQQVDFQGRQIRELQENDARRSRAWRAHEPWDRAAVRALPEDFPPPPPLDVWDSYGDPSST
jgi:hypothetical protein